MLATAARIGAVVATVAGSACGAGPDAAAGGAESTSTGGSASTASGRDAAEPAAPTGEPSDTDETADADDADSTGGAEPLPRQRWAEGLDIAEVTANQGVTVALAQAGAWLPAPTAPLISGRETLVQATWRARPDWASRAIEARLTVANDSVAVLSDTRIVGTEPSTLHLDHSFSWSLRADQVTPQTRLMVEFLEVDGPERTVDAPPRVPLAGPATVGFAWGPAEIHVRIVPIAHQFGDSCTDVPALTASDLAIFGELLHLRNPTQRVDIELRAPLVWTESLDSYASVLDALAQLRFDDGAPPDLYYYGLVHHCVRTGGATIAIPEFPTPDNAWTRTGIGPWREDAAVSASTFVHEMGHSQGRDHVACSGAEYNPDRAYPYADGKIGVWGLAIPLPRPNLPLSLRQYDPATTFDHMGYCTGSHWISDYGWALVDPFVREISGWASAHARPDPTSRLLIGTRQAGRPDRWFVVPGRVGERTPQPGLFVEFATQAHTFQIPAHRYPSGDADAVRIVAALPPRSHTLRRATLIEGGAAPRDIGLESVAGLATR